MARISTLMIIVAVLVPGCQRSGGPNSTVCDVNNPVCADDLICNPTIDGGGLCAPPITISGTVVDLSGDQPIAGARVQALDANGAAVGAVAIAEEDGSFMLHVPALRDSAGQPRDSAVTLQAQAAGFQEFPTALRPALPIALENAVADGDSWRIDDTLSTIKLIDLKLPSETLGTISGQVTGKHTSGLLMVAESDSVSRTGFSDREGNYVIYNVPPGQYVVKGYASGIQMDETIVDVHAGAEVAGVDLVEVNRDLNRVSGSVQIVNATGGAVTSVILAVASTFNETSAKGTAPPGLRVADVSGAFTLADVPDGHYVVLAAFENDALVRDPDQSIGGTEIVRITVPDPDLGNDLMISEGFKVTGALSIVSPGADGLEQIGASQLVFVWEDDSSEDGYEIELFDAFGEQVWHDEIEGVSGSEHVSLTYTGPSLEHGMIYQFRVTSFRERNSGRAAISKTEDLRGAFEFVNIP